MLHRTKHKQVLISIDEELLSIIDAKRGFIPRSVFIEQILVHTLPTMVENRLTLEQCLNFLDFAIASQDRFLDRYREVLDEWSKPKEKAEGDKV